MAPPSTASPGPAITRPRSAPSRRRRATKASSSGEQLVAVVVGASAKFVCPLCASTFGRRCELKRHVHEVHALSGGRRFRCKHASCPKSFTRKDALAKHDMVKHQGKRRFVCDTCSEKFTSRYDLTRHNVRVHSNVKKRFTCEVCAAGFSQKSQLTMHKGRVHAPTSSGARVAQQQRRPASPMDSLAAAAVAVARQEAADKSRRHGTPSRKREAEQASAQKDIRSAEVGARNALALLQAAAVLQPPHECQGEESTCTTVLTEATRAESGPSTTTGLTDEEDSK